MVDQEVKPISSLAHPTIPSKSDISHVIERMQSWVSPALPSESDFHQEIESMPSLINPALPLESELSASHIFFTTSSEPSGKGGTNPVLNEPFPSSRIASFDWDSLVEPCLPSDAPF